MVVVKALVEAGADVNAFEKGVSPSSSLERVLIQIKYGRIKDCIEILKLLIKAGANPNIKDGSGNTPLFELVEYLPNSQNVPDENERNKRIHEIFEALKILLEAGADPNIQNDSGQSPFYRAKLWDNNNDIIKILEQYRAK